MQRILMIDDDKQVASVLAMALEALGHEVVVSSDTDKCEALLQEIKPDFVLLDLMMPGRSGIELLKPVREITPDAVVCMMTGLVDTNMMKEALRNGAWNVLYKPYSLTELHELLTMTELLTDAIKLEQAMTAESASGEVSIECAGDKTVSAQDIARLVHFADSHGCDQDTAHRRLPVVAGELLMNAKVHGARNDANQTYAARLLAHNGRLRLSVSDSGEPFNWHKALATSAAPSAGGGTPGLQLTQYLAKSVAQDTDKKTVVAEF